MTRDPTPELVTATSFGVVVCDHFIVDARDVGTYAVDDLAGVGRVCLACYGAFVVPQGAPGLRGMDR